MRKYELTEATWRLFGVTLHRIRAVQDFSDVHAGDLGGWIEKEENLDHRGDAWVYEEAMVFGDARVRDNAKVREGATIFDRAVIGDGAEVSGDAVVRANGRVDGNAKVRCNARVESKADYLCIGPIGTHSGYMTFYRSLDGAIWVACGCFDGTIDAFAQKVAEEHGDNRHGKAYRAAIELARAAMKEA